MHINDLSPELLINIFQRLTFNVDPNAMFMTADMGPLLPTQVCSLWRQIAVASPELWTVILLKASKFGSYLHPHVELLRLWLVRSKDRPLTIRIRIAPWYTTDVMPGLAVLVGQAHRWKEFDVMTGGSPYWDELEEIDAPMLERLALWWSRSREDATYIPIKPGARLSHLTWSNTATHRSRFQNLPIFWQSLTELIVETRVSLLDVLHALTNCPLLKICTFSDIISPDDEQSAPAPPDPPIELTDLTTLDVGSQDDSFPVDFVFRSLIAPNLSDLAITLDYTWSQAPFLSFLTNSQCTLKRLALTDTLPKRESDLVECLRRVQSIQTLDIEDTKTPPGYVFFMKKRHMELLSLQAGNSEDNLCPNLSKLRIPCSRRDVDALADMLESRWRVPPDSTATRLSTVEIQMQGKPAWTERLKALKDDGLDIKFDED